MVSSRGIEWCLKCTNKSVFINQKPPISGVFEQLRSKNERYREQLRTIGTDTLSILAEMLELSISE
jgi:hypothetical protein